MKKRRFNLNRKTMIAGRPSLAEGQHLLRRIEEYRGSLGLHHSPIQFDGGPKEWWEQIYGVDVPCERHKGVRLPNQRNAPFTIDMFNDPALLAIIRGAKALVPTDKYGLESVAVGWTSIPILNANAVRYQNILAVALNLRLPSVLKMANSLMCNLRWREADVKDDEIIIQLQRVLRSSASPDFDRVLLDAAPYAIPQFHFLGNQFKQVQVLFVLLHEYAHITLGHLNENKLWQGHPLTSDSAEVFASSFQKEYEADEQAFRWLMEGDWSSLVEKDFLFGENNAPYIISELFVWLSGIAPANQSSYYAIPRSHPHPLDRAKNLLRYASNIGWGSDELDRVFEYEAAIVKSF